MWVNTMVLTSPMRRASHAAPRCESALAMRAPANSAPITAMLTPKRSKKKYERSAVVRRPPARLSIPNSAQILHSIRRVSGEICAGRAAGRARSGESPR